MARQLQASSWSLFDGDAPLRYPHLLALHVARRLEALLSFGALPGYRSFRPAEPVIMDENKRPTPTRQICNAFLKAFDFQRLRQRLGPLHVLDIGCGRGDYARHFFDAGAESYHGVDIAPRADWAAADSRMAFQALDCGRDAREAPGRCNLIFSQSALEHIRWDVSLMQDLARHCEVADHPIVQIHLLPAPASISLYGAHGWRVYAAAQIARLLAPFGGVETRAYGLGSHSTRALHYRRFADNRFFRVIAAPVVRHSPDEAATGRVAAEQAEPSSARDADFLALVIASGLELPDGLVRGAPA